MLHKHALSMQREMTCTKYTSGVVLSAKSLHYRTHTLNILTKKMRLGVRSKKITHE